MADTLKRQAPDWAFICTAGLGTRMLPLTKNVPKPLVLLHDQALLDHIIDHLLAAGIKDIVLNAHYLAPKLEEWAKARAAQTPNITITIYHEEPLLDTGGGLSRVLREEPHRASPFFMINGDAFWVNEALEQQTLSQMVDQWMAEDGVLLLLLEDISKMVLTEGVGDYAFIGGKPMRQANRLGEYMFAGVRIVDPALIRDSASYNEEIYSFLNHMDEAEAAGSLRAHIHRGQWYHISTPDDVTAVEALLRNDSSAPKREVS